MSKIRKAFENFWKIKMMSNKFYEKDKEQYYELFLDGYGCAVIDLEDAKCDKDDIEDRDEK